MVFARRISPEELAVRMGGTPGAAVELTGLDVTHVLHRSQTSDNAVARVGACGAWSYAVLHLADPGRDDLAVRASRDGVEVIQYVAMTDHPLAQFNYLCDGRTVCGFGIGEEAHRWGQNPDHLLPTLVVGGVLPPDGTSHQAAPADSALSGKHLTLAVLEHHFGLCLPENSVMRAQLPAYTIRGTLSLGPDPDVDIIRAWAAEHGYPLDWGQSGHVPTSIREAFAHATGRRSS
ncbi:DUF6461 domain-containing protein [Streptomyces longisporus]|uniref:DUF6461 domain-containing protein n=1 Tax=Streptomyces longisporus TaxID=1948 RepID=UPI0031DEF753